MVESTSGSLTGGPPASTASASHAAFAAASSATSAQAQTAAAAGPRGLKRCSSQQGRRPQGPPQHRGDHLKMHGQAPLVEQPSIRSSTFSPADDSAAIGSEPLMTACANTAADMHTDMQSGGGLGLVDATGSRTDAPAAFGSGGVPSPAQLWGGEVTCGVNRQIGARAAVRTCVRALAATYGSWVPSEVMQRLCISNGDHIAELQRAFPVQAADMHGAEGELRNAEGFAYHTAVTEALGFVLSELRDSMRDMAGLMNVMVCFGPGPRWPYRIFATPENRCFC